MSNEQCTVTIVDIYGAEWWDRNKAELDREWEWSFGVARCGNDIIHIQTSIVSPYRIMSGKAGPVVILHRRKPKPPTLREVYRVDEVTIPAGWEWTGEWRVPGRDDYFQSGGGGTCAPYVHRYNQLTWENHRLILRERQKKVWFKAEAEMRVVTDKDWAWSGHAWLHGSHFNGGLYLCATRHEEIDQTVQVVTQAMVDEVVKI